MKIHISRYYSYFRFLIVPIDTIHQTTENGLTLVWNWIFFERTVMLSIIVAALEWVFNLCADAWRVVILAMAHATYDIGYIIIIYFRSWLFNFRAANEYKDQAYVIEMSFSLRLNVHRKWKTREKSLKHLLYYSSAFCWLMTNMFNWVGFHNNANPWFKQQQQKKERRRTFT